MSLGVRRTINYWWMRLMHLTKQTERANSCGQIFRLNWIVSIFSMEFCLETIFFFHFPWQIKLNFPWTFYGKKKNQSIYLWNHFIAHSFGGKKKSVAPFERTHSGFHSHTFHSIDSCIGETNAKETHKKTSGKKWHSQQQSIPHSTGEKEKKKAAAAAK